jgi:hypothetical protein
MFLFITLLHPKENLHIYIIVCVVYVCAECHNEPVFYNHICPKITFTWLPDLKTEEASETLYSLFFFHIPIQLVLRC